MHLKSEGGEIGVYLCPENFPVSPVVDPLGGIVKEEEFDLHKFLELEGEGGGGGEKEEEEEKDYCFAYSSDEGLRDLFIY
jgi:hypothetical protein